ncbi:uncharacterized protein METZ01_LOCUS15069 [marine metagenome]|uniref:Uncharacterized protein n=1 Tax=marine metagenome TaxID=408172 RepID=A0A381P5J2_9ZZZZ
MDAGLNAYPWMRHGFVKVGFRECIVLDFPPRDQQYVISPDVDRATRPQWVPSRVLDRCGVGAWVHDLELRGPTGESVFVVAKPGPLVVNIRVGGIVFRSRRRSVLDQEPNEPWERRRVGNRATWRHMHYPPSVSVGRGVVGCGTYDFEW